MKLHSYVPLENSRAPINYGSKLLLVGSCFVTNIGGRLDEYQFPMLQNPLGILYHPQAILGLIERAVREESFREEEIFFHLEQWHSYDAHSDLNRNTPAEMLLALNGALKATTDALKSATHLIITLGTAWVYRHKRSGKLVANCHKVPQTEFEKKLLSPDQVAACLRQMLDSVFEVNRELHCIFTISPVRHLKDGFSGNQRSKAHLISGLHSVLDETRERGRVSYFPAYELVMDELRDYRFYDSDLVHPNKLAIEYVWEKFREVCIDKDAYKLMDEIAAIRNALNHRPFNPNSEGHRNFMASLEERISVLRQRYPFITFDR